MRAFCCLGITGAVEPLRIAFCSCFLKYFHRLLSYRPLLNIIYIEHLR